MISKIKNLKLAIVGLGYVGLPLALEFAKKRQVVGFDINKKRIKELNFGIDKNFEFTKKELQSSKKLNFTNSIKDIKSSNCYIITVPTPIDKFKKPDLRPLLNSSELIAKMIKKGDLIIFESTVYPGCIEEICVPILEKFSGLTFNKDFFCGYSPERINPGDKIHTISNIKKITSGSTIETANLVDKLYNEIVTVGTYKSPSIKVAEAAKVIENTQRDLNIALVNELSVLFGKMNIDTQDVLDAAGTKWNFLPFKPGLVGGHCIGVDPYYLTYKAEKLGYNPKIILAGRELNDNMGAYVASELIKNLKKRKIKIERAKILIMGLTFKENCADIRNSGIESVISKLKKSKCILNLYDPWVEKKKVRDAYNILAISKLSKKKYDAVVIAVAHEKFKKMGIKSISNLCKKNHVIYDLKWLFKKNLTHLRL
jgi:UDP-N-acetyl-D-galactosamine dehydrogenase